MQISTNIQIHAFKASRNNQEKRIKACREAWDENVFSIPYYNHDYVSVIMQNNSDICSFSKTENSFAFVKRILGGLIAPHIVNVFPAFNLGSPAYHVYKGNFLNNLVSVFYPNFFDYSKMKLSSGYFNKFTNSEIGIGFLEDEASKCESHEDFICRSLNYEIIYQLFNDANISLSSGSLFRSLSNFNSDVKCIITSKLTAKKLGLGKLIPVVPGVFKCRRHFGARPVYVANCVLPNHTLFIPKDIGFYFMTYSIMKNHLYNALLSIPGKYCSLKKN